MPEPERCFHKLVKAHCAHCRDEAPAITAARERAESRREKPGRCGQCGQPFNANSAKKRCQCQLTLECRGCGAQVVQAVYQNHLSVCRRALNEANRKRRRGFGAYVGSKPSRDLMDSGKVVGYPKGWWSSGKG